MFDSKKLAVQKDVREQNYWRKQLKDISPYLDLNTDRPRKNSGAPNLSANVDNSSRYTLSQAEAIALQQVAQKNQVTLPTLLFCALQVLLYRYTKQSDLVVGYENVLASSGLAILPIRMVIPTKTFTELLTAAELDSLALISIAEAERVLYTWNQT